MKKLEHITPEQWEEVNSTNKAILDDFLTNSVELSEKSKKAYESNLKIWFVWVKDNLGNKEQTKIKPLEYKKFQNWMVNRGCSSADVNNKRAAISSLNGYIEIYYGDEYPHSLRASRATQAVVEDGKDVEAVRQLLGHEDQSTTLNFYIVRQDDENIDDLF